MGWMFVLSEGEAARWVLDRRKMAFSTTTVASRINVGDEVAIYVSRGAFHNPTRDEAQVVALGNVTSLVQRRRTVVAARAFEALCELSLDEQLPLREGLPFRPLVPHLSFIRHAHAWPAYVRRAVVYLPESDYRTIARAFRSKARRTRYRASPARPAS